MALLYFISYLGILFMILFNSDFTLLLLHVFWYCQKHQRIFYHMMDVIYLINTSMVFIWTLHKFWNSSYPFIAFISEYQKEQNTETKGGHLLMNHGLWIEKFISYCSSFHSFWWFSCCIWFLYACFNSLVFRTNWCRSTFLWSGFGVSLIVYLPFFFLVDFMSTFYDNIYKYIWDLYFSHEIEFTFKTLLLRMQDSHEQL